MVYANNTVYSIPTVRSRGIVFTNGTVLNQTPIDPPVDPQVLGAPISISAPVYPANSGHALAPTGAWGSLTAPYPTNASWLNIAMKYDPANDATEPDKTKVYPYTARTHNKKLKVDYPSLTNSASGIIESFAETVRFEATETFTDREVMSSDDDLCVTHQWQVDSTHYMECPFMQGSPYVSMKYMSLTPKITTAHAILSINGSAFSGNFTGTKFKLVFNNGQTWILYFDSSVTLTSSTSGGYSLTANSTYTGWVRTAILRDSGYETDLDTYSPAIPTGGTVAYSSAGDTATITYTYTKAGSGTILMAYLPHHQDMLSSPTYATPQFSNTIKGTLKTIASDSISFTLDLITTTEKSSTPIEDAKLSTIQSALNTDASITINPTDPYFGGKKVSQLGRIALIADELNDTSNALTIRSNLADGMSEWIPLGGTETPIYDSVWGGICTPSSITSSSVDFGHGYYNDHHFHWGYWVYAAYCLGKGDSSWLSTYEEHINSLLRDYMNPSYDDPYFPKLRNFDQYAQHSWARGLFSWGDGSNQESTSEAVNAYYAAYLWGDLTGNDNIKEMGRILCTLEIKAAQKYWQIDSADGIYASPAADNKAVGVLHATKFDFTTFFCARWEYIHGIQLIPITPICEVLYDSTWITEQYPVIKANTYDRTYVVDGGAITLTNGGTGYSGSSGSYTGHTFANNVSTTSSGSGTGLTLNINIRNSDGKVTEVFVVNKGTGYAQGDTISLVNGSGGLSAGGSGFVGTLKIPDLAQGWRNFLIAEHAVIDKAAAWTEALALTGYDDGNTKTNMLYWVATRP